MSTTTPPLILASTSAYRQTLLARLGVPFRAVPPRCDEDTVKARIDVPDDLVRALARMKAESVAATEPEAIVIGSDQLGVLPATGEILGKPGTREAAVAQLRRMSGQTHHLLTAVAIVKRGEWHEFIDVTRLRMCSLSEAQIRRYVDADDPVDCAGSYKIESRGIALFDSIDTSDHTAITGLPLIATALVLRSLGVEVP